MIILGTLLGIFILWCIFGLLCFVNAIDTKVNMSKEESRKLAIFSGPVVWVIVAIANMK